MIYLMSGHISLLTMKKCISLKCINLFNFLARLLLTLEKCISLECIGSCFIFSHLLTYLGPLCQLKGVSATAEKRVLVCQVCYVQDPTHAGSMPALGTFLSVISD